MYRDPYGEVRGRRDRARVARHLADTICNSVVAERSRATTQKARVNPAFRPCGPTCRSGRSIRPFVVIVAGVALLQSLPLAIASARADGIFDTLRRIEDYLEIEAEERAFNRAVERDRLEIQSQRPRSEPSWHSAPDAQPFSACGAIGQGACLPVKASRSPTVTVQPSVVAGLDATPDLAGRWRQINDDPAFLEWLDRNDLLSGQKRLLLLRDAYSRGDVDRTAAFFRAFIMDQARDGRAAVRDGLLVLFTAVVGFHLGLACIPAVIARRAGRSFLWWWLYAVFLWMIALVATPCFSSRVTGDRAGKQRTGNPALPTSM